MPSALFSPIDIGPLHLVNRIAVAPMCMYSADDGSATDWHLQHWMNLAMSGAGMMTVEATAVERRGRITHRCLGIYEAGSARAARRTLDAARAVAAPGTRIGMQLAHAGRKASQRLPWQGRGPLQPGEDPWPVVGPSAVAYDEGWPTPEALGEAAIERTVEAFAAAARRADEAGFDFVELHMAHGYLMQSFLSSLSNRRTDQWGGSMENRLRFPVAVARAVRAALPPRMAVGARISATEWVDGGFGPDDAVTVAKALKAAGIVFVCASSGGNSPAQKVPATPGYQVHLAERIRREAGIASRAVGLIETADLAETIVAEERADLVALGRAILADPRWPWRAAVALGGGIVPPVQYDNARGAVERSVPAGARKPVAA